MAERLFFPYRFAGHAVDVAVTEVRLDGKQADQLVDADARAVILRDIEHWNEAVVRLRATIAPDRLKSLFPEDEREDPPCRMLLVAHCDATRWRDGVVLQPTGLHGTWEGVVTVSRRRVRGALLASVMLIRDEAREAPLAPFGSKAHIRLANSAEWRISFDRQATPPGGFMNIQWDDFANSKSSKRKNHSTLLYYFDLEGDDPTLYLNEGIAGLKEVLSSEATRGKAAAVREIVFSAIAQSVWLAMATESLLAIQPGMDDPDKQWQRNVLTTIRPLLGTIDPVSSIRNPNDASTLVEALATAVQTHEPLKQSVQKLLSEIDANDSEA